MPSSARRRGAGLASRCSSALAALTVLAGSSVGARSERSRRSPSTRFRSRTASRSISGSPRASSRTTGSRSRSHAPERQRHRARARGRNGDIGYIGWVPDVHRGHDRASASHALAASEVEGTTSRTTGKTSSSRAQLDPDAGRPRWQDVAVNALKGVGEMMIKAAFEKLGVDPNSVKLLALPFPAMRSALEQRPGRRDLDAGAVPLAGAEPGRRAHRDGPGAGAAVSCRTGATSRARPGHRRTRRSRSSSGSRSTSRSSTRRGTRPRSARCCRQRRGHPAAGLEPGARPWQLLRLARYARQFGIIAAADPTKLVPGSIDGVKILKGDVGNRFIALRKDGKLVTRLPAGKYSDHRHRRVERRRASALVGPGVDQGHDRSRAPARPPGTSTSRPGKYAYSSPAKPGGKKSFRVT